MSEFVIVETKGRVRQVIFNRPAQKNALTHEMYAAASSAISTAPSEGVRAIVISGAGGAFTAGNDLGDFAKPMPPGKPPVVAFLEALRDTDIPVAAAVGGVAVGIGLTMLLHCDLAFAAEDATFRAPFPLVGLVPEAGSSLLLPRVAGMAWANDIFLAGRTLSATEALSVGLVSRIYPGAELLERTLEVARQISAMAPNAVRQTKALVRRGRDEVKTRMREEGEVFAAQLASDEFREAATAFLQKRAPAFG